MANENEYSAIIHFPSFLLLRLQNCSHVALIVYLQLATATLFQLMHNHVLQAIYFVAMHAPVLHWVAA